MKYWMDVKYNRLDVLMILMIAAVINVALGRWF